MNTGLPQRSAVKESASKPGDMGLIPGSGRSTGGGNGNPSILAGKSHGQSSVECYSPQGGKQLDTTEQLNMQKHTYTVPM